MNLTEERTLSFSAFPKRVALFVHRDGHGWVDVVDFCPFNKCPHCQYVYMHIITFDSILANKYIFFKRHKNTRSKSA